MEEQKKAATSYIITFYEDVQSLTHHYLAYCNVLAELKARYGNDTTDIKNIDEEEAKTVAVCVQNIRYYLSKCYIEYKGITKVMKLEPDQEMTESYKNLKGQYIFTEEILESYVVSMNSVLLNSVIKEMLVSNQEVIDKVYGN